MSSLFSRVCGERRLPRITHYLPAIFLGFIARRRRALGLYDLRTLALFREIKRRRQSVYALLDYALFRRDLGYPLKSHWAEVLVTDLSRLSERKRRWVLALWFEAANGHRLASNKFAGQFSPLTPALSREGRGSNDKSVSKCTPSPLAGEGWGEGGSWFESQNKLTRCLRSTRGPQVPAVAALLQQAGCSTDVALAQMFNQQSLWRDEFAQYIRGQCHAGVCVVGNSSVMRRAVAGEWIDRHAAVVRFNRFSKADSDTRDVGNKLDVWCMAPDFRGDAPQRVPWIVVTGPDMQFRMRDWRTVKPALASGSRVLTVPLSVWRNLVSELMAPPSAGLLVLAWVREIMGSWQGIHAIGFGVSADIGVRYHHSDPKQAAVARHNWDGERLVMRRWRDEGLDWVVPSVVDTTKQTFHAP